MTAHRRSGCYLALACGGLLAAAQLAPARVLSAPAATRYDHPSGFSFTLPRGWTGAAGEGTLVQLKPPGAATTTELYVVSSVPATLPDLASPYDPRIVAFVDQQVQGLSSALARSGAAVSVPLPGRPGVLKQRGALLTYSATGAQGQVVVARAYVCVVKDQGVILFAMGLAASLKAREAALLQLFRSVGATPASAARATPGPSSGPRPALTGQEIGQEAWGFKLRTPAGWVARHSAEGALMGHNAVTGIVIVKPHEEESLPRLRALMQSGLAEGNTRLSPAGAIQSFGARGLVADFTGVLDGATARGRVWVTLSPYGGGGAIVLAVSTPDKVTPALLGAGAAVAGGLRYVKSEVTGLMLHLAGMWGTATAHTNTRIVFGRDGRFYANHESYASGRFTTSRGVQTGHWNYAGGRKAAGRWTVRGDKMKGRITVRMNDGSVNTYDYRVHVEKGRTYWREYYFNGRLYSKSN